MKTFLLAALLTAWASRPAHAVEWEFRGNIVYGHKDGMALVFDVLIPQGAKGAGVIQIPNHGWFCNRIPQNTLQPIDAALMEAGYTIFILSHGSAPRYNVLEQLDDLRRGVRFIRTHAKDYGIDSQRLGAWGSGSGGQLAMLLATTGDDGNPKAEDPVLRTASRLGAAVSLHGPSDVRGWTKQPPALLAQAYKLDKAFAFDAKREAEASPLLQVSKDDAPLLLLHGANDKLIPPDQSVKILQAYARIGAASEMYQMPGAGHGFNAEATKAEVAPRVTAWFDQHLKGAAQGGS